MAVRRVSTSKAKKPIGRSTAAPARLKASAPETKGERTRAELIDASYKLFNNRGYNATSMRDIADEAGLALGGIYNHFGSKEDIFTALVMERHPFFEIMPALQAAQGDTIEALTRDAARRMTAKLDKKPEFLNLIFIELVEFKGKHVTQLFQTFFPPLMEFAQRFEQVDGRLRSDLPLPVMLRSFIGLFFSYAMTELLIGSQLPAEAHVNSLDHFVDIYLHGVLAEG
jgi:AcrR family transcriptional regulator